MNWFHKISRVLGIALLTKAFSQNERKDLSELCEIGVTLRKQNVVSEGR